MTMTGLAPVLPVFQPPGAAPATPTAAARPTLGALRDLVVIDGARLSITSPDALAKLDRKRMSHSTADALASCPARWAVERLSPSASDPFAANSLGTSAHAVLEDLFGLPAQQRTLTSAMSLLDGLELRHRDLDVPASQDMERWRSEVAERITGLWRIEDPTKVTVVNRELALNDVEIDGVPFTGFLDRTDLVDVRGARPGVKIVDYKAGKVQKVFKNSQYGDGHGTQLREYALAMQARNGELPVAAEVYYTRHGEKRVVTLEPSELDKARAGFVTAWDNLHRYVDGSSMPMKASGLCGWCPLVLVCPTAQAAGKTEAKIAAAEVGPRLGLRVIPTAVAVGAPASVATSGAAEPGVPVDAPADYDPAADFAPSGDDRGAGDAARPPSYHADARADRPTEDKENDMSPRLREDKVWEETAGDTLNPNSFAATAAFGLVSMAVELLHKNDQPVKGSSVNALSRLLAYVVNEVQQPLSSRTCMQDGLHTRLRGALRTAVDTLPMPWGGDTGQWQDWTEIAVRRVNAIAQASLALWEAGPVAEPWFDMGDLAGESRAA